MVRSEKISEKNWEKVGKLKPELKFKSFNQLLAAYFLMVQKYKLQQELKSCVDELLEDMKNEVKDS